MNESTIAVMTNAQRVRMDKESDELDNRTVDIWPD